MFETIIQGQNSARTGRKRTVLVSLVVHALVLGVLIVIPLIYYQTIPGGWDFLTDAFAATLPDPVPPSPPPPTPPNPVPRVPVVGPAIVLVPILIEPPTVPLPPDTPVIEMPLTTFRSGSGGNGDAVVPSDVLSGTTNPALLPPARIITPPPPPPKPRKAPMLISTLDPSRVIYRVEPVYPPLALQARVQGAVMLRIKVSEMGTVESVEVVSGNPLLTQAAVDAVKQWRYKPTILNGEPVPVIAAVTVNFNFRR